jgi:glucose-1-phosphate adenylyltransferase
MGGMETRILAIVQAGGAGGRMDVLTLERAKPGLPVAGSYRLIDFPLSNLVNSGLDDVWLSVQYQAGGLEDQVHNGRPWDLDRTQGGLRLLVPQQGTGSMDEDGFAQGNADELYRLRDDIRRSGADLVLVMSADHIYRLDCRDVVRTHLEHDAELTMVVTDISDRYGEDAASHGVVEADAEGRVTGFAYKPDEPATTVVATEVFCYRADVLIDVLEELHREQTTTTEDRDEGDSGLGDFGDLLVPELVDRGRTVVHELGRYWRDLGQPHHYLNAHLELARRETDLFEKSWPVRTQQPQREPAYVEGGATVVDSLLSPGSIVGGSVSGSVLGPGVVVERGAEVVDSVVFADTVVRAGARVERAIVDTGCELREGASVGGADVALDDPDAVPIVGRDSVVGAVLGAGSRVPPGSTV